MLLQPAAAHLALDASLVESFSVRRVHLGRVVQHVDKYVSGVLKKFIQVSTAYTFDYRRMQTGNICNIFVSEPNIYSFINLIFNLVYLSLFIYAYKHSCVLQISVHFTLMTFFIDQTP